MLFKVSTHRRMVFALVLVAGFVVAGVVALTLSLSSGAASADSGGNGEATFTKWVTTCPLCEESFAGADMVGVVGGNVGAGTFIGKVNSDSDDGTTWTGDARYEFNGGKHSFKADVHVTQNDATGIAEITGVVTDGWLAGARVTGGYRTMSTCPIPTPGNVLGTVCFKGTLHIDAASAP